MEGTLLQTQIPRRCLILFWRILLEPGGPERVVSVAYPSSAAAIYLQVSLEVGAYRTSEGKPWILPVVKKAEKILAKKVSSLILGSKQGHLRIHEFCKFALASLSCFCMDTIVLMDSIHCTIG